MRKIVLGLALSLDGYIEGPRGEYDWCFTDQDYGMREFFARVDSMFIGRKSYEVAQALEDGGSGFPQLRKYVFSTTLQSIEDGAVLINRDVRKHVEAIKQEQGKDIWLFGGASLTHTLMREGLVDEIWLSVHPILLGSGTPLFAKTEKRQQLKLLENKHYDTGLVSVRYQVLNENAS